MNLFSAAFYPTTINENILMWLMVDIFTMMDDIDTENHIIKYYDGLSDQIKYEIVIFLTNEKISTKQIFKDDQEMVESSFYYFPINLKKQLTDECLDLWSKPNIKNYHNFIQSLYDTYDSVKEKNRTIKESINAVWRGIDTLRFFNQMKKVDTDDIYNELHIIEKYHVEKLI